MWLQLAQRGQRALAACPPWNSWKGSRQENDHLDPNRSQEVLRKAGNAFLSGPSLVPVPTQNPFSLPVSSVPEQLPKAPVWLVMDHSGWVAGNSQEDLQGSPSGLVQTALRRGGGGPPCSLRPESNGPRR